MTPQQKMAAIFNEWAKRYAANPEAFGPILDSTGAVVDDYGVQAAHYYGVIESDMEKRGDFR